MPEREEGASRWRWGPAIVGGCTGLSLIAVVLLRWELMQLLTPFLAPLVELGAWLLSGAVALVLGGLALIKSLRSSASIGGLSIVACMGGCALAPVAAWDVAVQRWLWVDQRQEVIEQILAGELGRSPGVVSLPEPLRRCSRGGEVIVEGRAPQRTVLFFTYRGILDSYSGFVWSESGALPDDGTRVELHRYTERWAWVAHQ